MIRNQRDSNGILRLVHRTDIIEQNEDGEVSTLTIVFLSPKKRNNVMVLRDPIRVLKIRNEALRIQEF
jgi:hypothetical protein